MIIEVDNKRDVMNKTTKLFKFQGVLGERVR